MKILHLGKFYPPVRGGMETMLELICRRTAGEVENTALVANRRWTHSVERHDGVRVERVPALAKIGAVAVCPTLPAALRAASADLIVLHEPNPMALLAYYLVRPAAPLVVWFHSEVIRPGWKYLLFYRPLLKYACERAARIVVSSPALASSAPQLHAWQNKCVVIPYGIEPPPLAETESVKLRAEEIKREHPEPLVLFVGRLVPYKGVDALIDSLGSFAATVLVAGNGPEREALERRVQAAGEARRVRFLGALAPGELAAWMRACDLLVLPSVTRQEAFGLVLVEAMACGKPIVSTELGTGTSWANQAGETGLVVPPRDPPALGDAIGRILRDPDLARRMGEAGRARAAAVFSADRMARAVLTLYRDVVRRSGEGRAA